MLLRTVPLLLALVVALPPAAGADGLRHRGVTYDTGTRHAPPPSPLSRERWSAALMEGEIAAIADALHASSVTVFGSDVSRLVQTAEAAREHGLHVWIQPRLYDRPQREVLAHLARTARAAERLRLRHGEVALNVGVESTLFTPGMIPGATWAERIEAISTRPQDWARLRRSLNDYLRRAAAVARRHFHGRITYSAGPWEAPGVDWRRFDVVGLDDYEVYPSPAEHVRTLERYERFGRPIVVTEFGTNAFVGAPELEGGGWGIVDYTRRPPEIPARFVRDERVQADYLLQTLDVFEAAGLEGAYVYIFISPDVPHSTAPRYDLDIASYALVKTIRQRRWGTASPYRWEPKLAFHALAARFAAAGGR